MTATAETVVRETANGAVQGARNGDVDSYKGIPYAAAPVDPLRFAPAQPPANWSGVRDCRHYGPISLQHLDPLSAWLPGCEWNFYHPGAVQSEDCLNLNVWAPRPDGSPRPVFVWIHGGAYLAGSGTGLWCDGTTLAASQNVVVITINYRLGALGGLALDEEGLHANGMLLDQIQALRWVKENIAAFGGDPDRVTVGGESAGAMSTCALMASPHARGLFHGAIVDSGHGTSAASPERARRTREIYLAALGLADTSDVAAELRRLDAQALLSAQKRAVAEMLVPFTPVVDGDVLPASPIEAFAAGDEAEVPLLIGTNTDEHNLFYAMGWGIGRSEGDFESRVTNLLADPDKTVVEAIADAYGPVAESDDLRWNALCTDRDWREPVRELSMRHADNGCAVFQYDFAYRSPVREGILGASHVMEIPFVFGNLNQRGVRNFVGDDPEREPVRRRIEQACTEAWGSFIRSGHPESAALPPWKPFRSDDRHVMRIDAEPEVTNDPYGARLDRWAELETAVPPIGI